MRTTPSKDERNPVGLGQELPNPRIEYQEPDFGTGSAGHEVEKIERDIEMELRKAIKKMGSESEQEKAPEPKIGKF